MSVWLGDIEFNSDIADSDGVRWYVDVDGWDKLDNRTSILTLPARHGERTAENLYGSRSISLMGTAASQTAVGYWAALNHLSALSNVLTVFASSPLLLSVDEEVEKQMSVLRSGFLSRCIADTVLQFELTLRADDPFKYAAIQSSLATAGVAVNAGTIITYPTFTLSAGGSPTFTNGAQSWSAGALLSGTVIDFKAMTILNGSTNYFSAWTPGGTWFGLNPGNNTLTSTVAGTWTWRSAWL